MAEETSAAAQPAAAAKRAFKDVPDAAEAKLAWSCAGEQLAYTARAGHVQIREDDGEPIGSMFCITYTLDGAETDPNRPVTFCFNGGPGSASVLINVGGLGPRRVVPNGDRRIGPAPYAIEDNPNTLLKVSDLVFVDALGTGWSVLADGVEGSRAYTLDNDADCFARFVAAWLEETGRWNAPLYLFGESYGTTRNAVLCHVLEQRSIALNGVVMLSAIFDWVSTIPGNDVNYVQLYPSFAAVANYFGRCPAAAGLSDDELFRAAMDFAELEIAPALLLGDRLPVEREAALAEKLSSFIGLDAAYLRRKHLRVELTDFRQELLRDKGLVCGRLDGRFTFEAGNFLQTSSEGAPVGDPSDPATMPAWAAGFRSIVANEIGYKNPRPYTMSAWSTVGVNWVHTHTSAGATWMAKTPNVAYDLAETMRYNPYMKVLILGGRYDLATLFLGPVEDMARMYLSPELKKNLSWGLYDAGHMIYVNPDAFDKMTADVEAFYRA
jgi:carboxypeptidase C (cathepsin A)